MLPFFSSSQNLAITGSTPSEVTAIVAVEQLGATAKRYQILNPYSLISFCNLIHSSEL